MKDKTDKFEMLKAVIERMDEFTGSIRPAPYKLMVDRDTIQRLIELDPPSFVEFPNGDFEFRHVRIQRNDYVEGIWIELQ